MSDDGPASAVGWRHVEEVAPELAASVRARLESAEHHVLATLRADGSPRLNGTNVLLDGGDLLVGCMPGTRRAADLRRDPRCALHTAPDGPEMAAGDARLDCWAVEVDEARRRAVLARHAGGAHDDVAGDGVPEGEVFALRVRAVSTVAVDGDRLVLHLWRPGTAVRTVERTGGGTED